MSRFYDAASRTPLATTLARIFIAAVVFNYPWERAQSTLYVGRDGTPIPWWQCFSMSLGDGLLVLLIFWIGWMWFGQPGWFEHPGLREYALMAVTGLVMIIPLEGIMIYGVEWWSYTTQMPLIPGVAVGVTSVAQMLLLPPLIFRVVAMWRRRKTKERAS
jgi:hypothetical protein